MSKSVLIEAESFDGIEEGTQMQQHADQKISLSQQYGDSFIQGDIKEDEQANDRYYLAVAMMMGKVLSFSSDYVISKYAMQRSQYLTPFDLCFGFMIVV